MDDLAVFMLKFTNTLLVFIVAGQWLQISQLAKDMAQMENKIKKQN